MGRTRTLLAALALLAPIAGFLATPGLAAAGQPDLVVASLATAPAEPLDGDVIVFVAEVANEGNASVNKTFAVTFLVGSTTLGKVNVTGLGAGNATKVTSPPWTADAGARNATAVVDKDKAVAETNETNNARTEDLDIGPHEPKPDLTLEEPTVMPASPQPDEETRVVLNVRNEGDAEAGPSKLGFFVDGDLKETADVPALGSGEMYRRGFSWWYSKGEHKVRIVADLAGDVAESDEHDNETRLTLDVGTPRPDLMVAALVAQPEAPAKGDPTRLVATIKNRGGAGAGASEAKLYLGDDLLATRDVPALGANATATVEADVTWPGGTLTARAVADAGTDVAESDEDNNARTLRIATSTAKPDLAVVALVVEPTLPAGGDRVVLKATVRNDGRAAAGASQLELRLDGALLGSPGVPELGPGAQHVAEWPWTAVEGWHDVEARADVAKQVAEASEANNVLGSRFAVAAPGTVRSDLAVTQLLAEPGLPAPGDAVTFVATVQAQGALAHQVFRVTFTIDEQPFDVQQGSAEGGTAQVRSRAWQAVAGTHEVRAAVEPVDGGAEADPQNNVYVLTLGAGATRGTGALPDIVVLAVGPDPRASLEANATVPVIATVHNQGPAEAGRFSVELLVDGQRLGSISVLSLAPGATLNVTWLEWTASPGEHQFEAVVDPVGLLAEGSDDNNRLSGALVVGDGPGAAGMPKLLPGPSLLVVAGAALLLARAARRRA